MGLPSLKYYQTSSQVQDVVDKYLQFIAQSAQIYGKNVDFQQFFHIYASNFLANQSTGMLRPAADFMQAARDIFNIETYLSQIGSPPSQNLREMYDTFLV